jgi:hypothetical protein
MYCKHVLTHIFFILNERYLLCLQKTKENWQKCWWLLTMYEYYFTTAYGMEPR